MADESRETDEPKARHMRPTVKLPATIEVRAPAEPAPVHESPGDGFEANIILIAHPGNRMLGARFRVMPGREVRVGRDPAAEIPLPDVPSVSRVHARLHHDGQEVVLIDLGSTNGTYVNDRRVHGDQLLDSGDRFQVGEVHFKFLHERDVEHAYHDAILQLVATDGLTEILNRRAYDEAADRELARAQRHERPLSLIMFDVDHFKSINDETGHQTGDQVLMDLANLVNGLIRKEDIHARVGGEEFAVLCPETDLDKAAWLAERLRAAIEEEIFSRENVHLAVTCSFGVALLAPEMTAKELYDVADQALYAAKRGGRNRVERAGS